MMSVAHPSHHARPKGLKEMSSTPYGPPFNDADADIILRSFDRVGFYVYGVILSKSSPFFKSMFSLPQPDAGGSEKKPVIDLTEDSRTIANLLTYIYPVATEPLSLDDMMDALAAARKYDMVVISQRLNNEFAESKAMQDSPVEAFCGAYSRKLGEGARVAAKASLKHIMSLNNIGDKLQYTNGPGLHLLWKFHRACCATAAEAISDNKLPWIAKSDSSWWDFARKIAWDCRCSTYIYRVGPTQDPWEAAVPWCNYVTQARKILLEHPCSEAVTDYSVLRPFYDEGVCKVCQKSLFGLPEFARLLGEEVERRVLKVRHFLAYFLETSHSMAPTEGRSRVAILTILSAYSAIILIE